MSIGSITVEHPCDEGCDASSPTDNTHCHMSVGIEALVSSGCTLLVAGH